MSALLQGFRLQLRMASLNLLGTVSTLIIPFTYGLLFVGARGTADWPTITGVATTGFFNVLIVQSISIIFQEKGLKTLAVSLVAPQRLIVPLLGRVLATAAQGFISSAVAVITVFAVWGVPAAPDPALVGVSALLTVLGFVPIFLLLLSALLRYRFFAGMTNGLLNMGMLLAGLFVPLDAIPGNWASVGYVLPGTWAVDALRQWSWQDVFVAAVLCCAWFALAIVYAERTERWLRTHPGAHHA
jgi:ABC-type polysaccharide/polyol phosphate export permease